MIDFLDALKTKNESLYYFGWLCFGLAILFLALTFFSTTKVNAVSAWYKPFKFAVSIGLYAWTMAWYCSYLPAFNVQLFNWSTIALLGFELLYIGIQASRGQLSHFNLSTPFYSVMYSLMAIAATLVSMYTLYIGILFFTQEITTIPYYYLWAIRLGILLFVVFSLEGFVMGARLSHTIGGPDGEIGLPVLNWSMKYGDPRISHFIGMHALQILPLLSFYLLKNTKITLFIAALYTLLAVFTLFQAFQGKPLIASKKQENGTI